MKKHGGYIVFSVGICALLFYLNSIGWSAFGPSAKKRTGPPGVGGHGYHSSYHK